MTTSSVHWTRVPLLRVLCAVTHLMVTNAIELKIIPNERLLCEPLGSIGTTSIVQFVRVQQWAQWLWYQWYGVWGMNGILQCGWSEHSYQAGQTIGAYNTMTGCVEHSGRHRGWDLLLHNCHGCCSSFSFGGLYGTIMVCIWYWLNVLEMDDVRTLVKPYKGISAWEHALYLAGPLR